MKPLGTLRLALIFAGCFLGAGYVSGQELQQFFGVYGAGGFAGIVIAIILLFLFSLLVLTLVQRSGIQEMDKIVIPWDIPALRFAVGALEIIFQFGIAAIMCAGIGALLQQLFSLPLYIGSGIFCAAVLAAALPGLRSLVSAFSVSVPFLVAVTLIFGIVNLSGADIPASGFVSSSGSGPWLPGAVIFSCYNIFGTIAILIPFGDHIKSRKTLISGLALGSLALLLIALSVLLSMALYPDCTAQELPMLALAANANRAFAYIYALLLAMAMFGTALSAFVALLDYAEKKSGLVEKKHTLFACAVMLLVYVSSLFGFGDLIGFVYPMFGYLSAGFLLTMLAHYIMLRFRGKKNV